MSNPSESRKEEGDSSRPSIARCTDPLPDHLNPVIRVVLTGGPCGGKTTSASVITERLQDLGWRVFRVPEAASILMSGGASFSELTPEQAYIFQHSLVQLMLSLEDSVVAIARACGERAIVICDRGAMDCSAYMSEDNWNSLVKGFGHTTIGLRDSRYDFVVHMVSAADGAEPFYNTETNVVRTETPEVARVIDAKIKEAWVGHPYFTVIDNSVSFEKKIQMALKSVCTHIGESAPGLIKRKFLVKSLPERFPVPYQEFDVEHDFIASTDGSQHRVRRRAQFGVCTYSHTVRYPDSHGQRLQLRRILSGREYISLLSQRDPSRVQIKKQRRSFVFENQYYELDTFLEPCSDLILLEAYMPTASKLPDFVDIIAEVTADKAFSLWNIALPPHKRMHPIAPIFDLLHRDDK